MSDVRDDWVKRVLGISIPALSAPAQSAAVTVKLQKARLTWEQTRKQAQAELTAVSGDLRAAVLAHNQEDQAEDEYDEGDLDAGLRRLEATLGDFDGRLLDALDDALNADDAGRPGRVSQARAILKQYRTCLASSDLLASIDDNAFRPCKIRQSLDTALAVVASAL